MKGAQMRGPDKGEVFSMTINLEKKTIAAGVAGIFDFDSDQGGLPGLLPREAFGDCVLHIQWQFKQASGVYDISTTLTQD
jgi:hypothetical protein